jgi:hypothetical protein
MRRAPLLALLDEGPYEGLLPGARASASKERSAAVRGDRAMRITLWPTTKIVELETATGRVPARIWEGTTDAGIAVHAFITRIGVDERENQAAFQQALEHQDPPSAAIAAYPLRLVL